MSRLIRALFCLLLVVAGSAHALIPPASRITGQWPWGLPSPAVSGTVAADVCAALLPAFIAEYNTVPGMSGFSVVLAQEPTVTVSGYCQGSYIHPDGQPRYPARATLYKTASDSCPANSTAVSGGCQCMSPYVEDPTHTSCVAGKSPLEQFCSDHAAMKNTFNQWGSIGKNSSLPSGSCYKPYPPFTGEDGPKGCQMVLKDTIAVPREGDPLLKDWSATGVMTGATCEDALATDAAPKAVDDPCPNGFPGTVNGVQKCIAAEPDKGIEGVKGTSQTNADGTKIDTKETTKCQGSICTTTTDTTTTTASGTVTNSTSTRTESLDEKCAKDPKNDVCKKTQGGAGSATSSMTCDTNSSAEGCGGEGAAIGDLYAKKDKTIGQVLTKAKNDLQSSPLGSSVSNFFSVSSGGSCPRTSGVIPFLNKTVTFDLFCTDFATQMFLIVRAVLFMLATWMAFRIAIDN